MVRRTAALLLAAGLLVGTAMLSAGTAGASPRAGAAEASGATAATAGILPMTRIRLRVDRCVHCPVSLTQAITRPHGGTTVWRTRVHRVRDGWVAFTVPTRRTRGMSINLNPRWSKREAITNVVFRYAHTRIGQRISSATAAHKKRAMGCWAGTDASKVVLRIRVVRFPVVDYAGNHGYAPRAWLARTHKAVPPMARAFKGTLANQDAFYCRLR
jgi:hypothetical protein